MSVNIEIPNECSLKLLAPEKDFKSVYEPMAYIQQQTLASKEERKLFRHAPRFVPAGQSTQMIVGATPDHDRDILRLSSALYAVPPCDVSTTRAISMSTPTTPGSPC